MSRIGKQPIQIPSGVEISIKDGVLTAKGPKGSLTLKVHERINVKVEDGNIVVERRSDEGPDRSLHGLTRTLIANIVQGVTQGFFKKLELHGVGYRIQLQGKNLDLSLGFSHPVKFEAPPGITFEIDKEKKNTLTVSGTDKALVGQVAADLRALRKPEPYKGKGFRYVGEVIRRKAGKAATAAAGGGAK